MKAQHLLWLSAMSITVAGFTNHSVISIADAVKNPKIEVRWTHDPNSPHYKAPLVAEITNSGTTPVSVQVDPGWVVEPFDSTYQNLVITDNQIIVVAPGKSVKKHLNAMCTESGDAGGASDTKYAFKGNKKEKLATLAAFIAEKKYHNSEAQQAVWSLMNRSGLEEIYGADTVAALALQQLVAKLRGESIPTYYKQGANYRNNYYYRGPLQIELGGFFEYQIAKSKSVEVAMFNERNILERELLKKHVSTPGKHRFDYVFDGSAFEGEKYYIRLIVDDKIALERVIPLKEWKNQFEQRR
jgi:hypothetical protein